MGMKPENKYTFNKPDKTRKRTKVDTHDGLHMTASSGYCYCYCRVCWEHNTLKGMCICPNCACGKFELTIGPANGRS